MQQSLSDSPQLDRATYERIRRIVYDAAGIDLKADKMTLVASRLSKRMRTLDMPTFRAYVEHLEADGSGAEMTVLLDAISTNVTYFFRESKHFDFIKSTVRTWREEGLRRLRFWSAACSTGEEPYSLAMALADQFTPGLDARILATDISTEALAKAMRGVYPKVATDSIPAALRTRHMERLSQEDGGGHSVSASIRDKIIFRHMNLMQQPFPLKGPLDMILCRNVMIYFDNPTREKLIREFFRLLKPGGYFIVSHSESLVGLDVPFETVRPSIYIKAAQTLPQRKGVTA